MKITIELQSLDEFHDFMGWQTSKKANWTPLEKSGMSNRTSLILQSEGIRFVEEAQALNDRQLLMFPNLGHKALTEIREWPLAKADSGHGAAQTQPQRLPRGVAGEPS